MSWESLGIGRNCLSCGLCYDTRNGQSTMCRATGDFISLEGFNPIDDFPCQDYQEDK